MNKKIGFRIKTAREHAHLTQEQLAELLDASPSFISRLETGQTMTSLKRLCQIADTLNISLLYLLDDLIQEGVKFSVSMGKILLW